MDFNKKLEEGCGLDQNAITRGCGLTHLLPSIDQTHGAPQPLKGYSFRFITNDRRIAENTLENRIIYQDEIQKILKETYTVSNVEYGNVSNGHERLAFTVNFNTENNIFRIKIN